MTLDEARIHQERWTTKYGHKICKHTQVNDFLTVRKRRILEYLVCMECGEVHVNPRKQLSLNKVKTLEEIFSEEGLSPSFFGKTHSHPLR